MMLQAPALNTNSAVVKEPVFRWWDYVCFLPLMGLNLAALTWFMASWLACADWQAHPVLLGLPAVLLVYNMSVH